MKLDNCDSFQCECLVCFCLIPDRWVFPSGYSDVSTWRRSAAMVPPSSCHVLWSARGLQQESPHSSEWIRRSRQRAVQNVFMSFLGWNEDSWEKQTFSVWELLIQTNTVNDRGHPSEHGTSIPLQASQWLISAWMRCCLCSVCRLSSKSCSETVAGWRPADGCLL